MTRVTADSNIYISALMFGGKPLQLLERLGSFRGTPIRKPADFLAGFQMRQG